MFPMKITKGLHEIYRIENNRGKLQKYGKTKLRTVKDRLIKNHQEFRIMGCSIVNLKNRESCVKI